MISTKPKGNHAGYIATSTIVQNFSRAVHQPTSSQPQQPRQHRHHHHAKAMETDQTRDEKRARRHLPHSSSLDTRGKAQMRATVSGWLKYKEFVIVYNTEYDVSSTINVAESLRTMKYSVGNKETSTGKSLQFCRWEAVIEFWTEGI